jgi:hypothetical protein
MLGFQGLAVSSRQIHPKYCPIFARLGQPWANLKEFLKRGLTMNTYMLNLLFDLNETQGVFSPDQPGGGSLVQTKSATWLKVGGGVPANVETANWQNLEKARNFLVPQGRNENICLRVAPIPNMNPALDPGATITLVTSFGAPRIASQKTSSPFQTVTGETVAAFSSQGPRNSPAGGGAVAWFFNLGPIQVVPQSQNVPHRYEFSVGVIVNSGAVVRTYGIDPEMDVGP